MTAPSNNQRDLQQQLDDAGRHWQPRHPGWDTLLDRLPGQEHVLGQVATRRSPDRWGRIAWRWGVVAASLLVAAAVGLLLLTGPDRHAQAQMLPIEVLRRGIQVTIFNASSSIEPTLFSPRPAHAGSTPDRAKEPAGSAGAGLMLVKDRRQVLHLRRGDNVVRFTDVAASIDPTSVRLVSDTDPLGTVVVEQNFEFDLATSDGILNRSLQRKVTCVRNSSQEVIEGYLLRFDQDDLVLSDVPVSSEPADASPRTHSVARRQLQAVRVAEFPPGLHTRPTLVWVLRTDKPGDHDTTLTYLCGDAVWHADYVAVLSDADGPQSRVDLKGWVTIDNRSGATYDNADLKLIAGDVNRVRDPWAPRRTAKGAGQFEFYAGARFVFMDFDSGLDGRQFVQTDFFEYKLYALGQPATIKDRQIKQLQLLKAIDVVARRRYLCRAIPGTGMHPEVRLQIENRESNNLGMPLPKGSIVVMATDGDGESQFVHRDKIDHTAKDEIVNISMGAASEVVYDYRIVETLRRTDRQWLEKYEFIVRNHKQTTADVRLVGRLADCAVAIVLDSSDKWSRHDARTLHVDFVLEPNRERRVTYTVSYRR